MSPAKRISGRHTSVGAVPRSYQVRPVILGRRRATQPMQVRPLGPTASLRVSSPPARDHIRTVGRHRPATRTLTLSASLVGPRRGADNAERGPQRRTNRPTTQNGPPEGRPVPTYNRRRPTLPGPCGPSTIGAEGLNCSVRNGKRCFPLAMTTGIGRDHALSEAPQNRTAPHRVSKKTVKPSDH